MFTAILNELGLKKDRDGYICFRLLEGADIYQITKTCRTSVE